MVILGIRRHDQENNKLVQKKVLGMENKKRNQEKTRGNQKA